jgi:hypothetical protein
MKSYVITTGLIFGLITGAHVLRMLEERRLATDPWFLLLTITTAALSLWALRVLLRTRTS